MPDYAAYDLAEAQARAEYDAVKSHVAYMRSFYKSRGICGGEEELQAIEDKALAKYQEITFQAIKALRSQAIDAFQSMTLEDD